MASKFMAGVFGLLLNDQCRDSKVRLSSASSVHVPVLFDVCTIDENINITFFYGHLNFSDGKYLSKFEVYARVCKKKTFHYMGHRPRVAVGMEWGWENFTSRYAILLKI